MSQRNVISGLAALTIVGALGFSMDEASAQPAGTDFSGGWFLKDPVSSLPDLLPAAMATWQANKAKLAARKPEPEPSLAQLSKITAQQSAILCFPMGFPRVMLTSTLPMYVVQSSQGVVIDFASGGPPRVIWAGLPHDEDYWPTYMGESVGKWEGDTLVVDTIRFVNDTYMGPQGLPHSDAMHLVERMRLMDGGKTLEDQIRIEDPKVLRQPWNVTLHFGRKDDYLPTQHRCQQG